MSVFNKQSNNKWLIIGLVLLNIATLTFHWVSKNRPPKKKPLHIKMQETLKEDLGFSEQQMEMLAEKQKLTNIQPDKISEQIWAIKNDLKEILIADTIDIDQATDKARQIGNLYFKREQGLILNFQNIYMVATKEQQQKFKTFFKTKMEENKKNAPKGPPPH